MGKLLSLLLLLTGIASAETLHVLALDVDERFVEPLLERCIGKDPAKLEDAIGKLRKLTPKKGVREMLDLEVDRDDPSTRIETGRLKYTDVPKRKTRVQLGHQHRWSRTSSVSRQLKLHAPHDEDRVLRYSFQFYHRLDDHWSLSAAIASPTGVLFVFEKLSAPDQPLVPPRWLLSTLLEEKPRGRFERSPADRLNSPPLGRAALVRLPDCKLGANATLDLAIYTGYSQAYSKSLVGFTALDQSANPQLKLKFPERALVKMDFLVEHDATTSVTHQASHTVPLEGKSVIGTFEATQRDNKREGSTQRSTPSKQRPKYHLEARLVTPEPTP